LLVFHWVAIIFGWASIVLFVVLVVYKFIKVKNLPLNLRWEVYPVPNETNEKRQYGGSYMEDTDWVKKPRHASKLAELAEIGSEIFFLKRVREHNPYGLWSLSMAMHWGLYILVLWLGLLVVSNVMPALTPLSNWMGGIAFLLGTFGSIALIIKRVTNSNLRLYTTSIDYFNLMFLVVIFGLGLATWTMDPQLAEHQTYINRMFTFDPISISPTVTGMFFALQAFVIYMPLSKLIHYIMKHFTFTEILWDDAFNVKGSEKDGQILRQLSYMVDWAAPHIGQGKTWLEDVQDASMGEGESDD